MKVRLVVILFFLCLGNIHSKMSEAQIKAAGRLVRNVCQPKAKVTDEQIENSKNGDFDESRKLRCYMDCCLQMFKVTKNGSFDLDSALVQLEQLPDDRKEKIKEALINCKDKGTGTEKCEAGYNLVKCLYFYNPKLDLIP